MDSCDQFLGLAGLDQESGRTSAECLEDVVVLPERRQHDDARGRHCPADFHRRLDAVDPRHADVEYGHRGAVAPNQFHGVVTVDGLGNDFDVRIRGKNGPHPCADHRLVVGDQHTDHRELTE